jgi:hypothetical protein
LVSPVIIPAVIAKRIASLADIAEGRTEERGTSTVCPPIW